MEKIAHSETTEQSAGERDPHRWETAGWRGGKCNILLASRLVYFERRRVERAMGSEWDGDLSRNIDRLLVLEDLLAEYVREGKRRDDGREEN